MSLKSAPFYWLECDGCGGRSPDVDDISAWADSSAAEDNARDSDWYVEKDGHYCESCAEKNGIHYCEGCDDRKRVAREDADGARWCAECAAADVGLNPTIPHVIAAGNGDDPPARVVYEPGRQGGPEVTA